MKEFEKLIPTQLANGVIFGLVAMITLFILPAFLVEQVAPQQDEIMQPPTMTIDPDTKLYTSPEPVVGSDSTTQIKLLQADNSVETLSQYHYLWGVVSAEMPASFELEALKAQAVAARTYTSYRLQNPKHETADICTNSGCCQAYITVADRVSSWGNSADIYTEKIAQAVTQTDGLGVLYQGRAIDALFFSSTSGSTIDAVEVWGTQVGYLQGVDSPEGTEVPNYHTTMTYTSDEVKTRLLTAYPKIVLTDSPDEWFGHTTLNSGGGVAQIVIGGVTLTGSQLRSLFSLRSTFFTVDDTPEGFLFSVTGYGHSVGMSQYGANAMAKDGSTFDEILTWYYTDTVVSAITN